MNLYRELVTATDVEELRRALAAAEDDRDRAQAVAAERLAVIEELRAQLRGEGR